MLFPVNMSALGRMQTWSLFIHADITVFHLRWAGHRDSYTRTAKGDNDITNELKREGQAPSTSPVTGSNKTAGSLGPREGKGARAHQVQGRGEGRYPRCSLHLWREQATICIGSYQVLLTRPAKSEFRLPSGQGSNR